MKIAVWYHCLLRLPGEKQARDSAVNLVTGQLDALDLSGVRMDELHLGVNGPASDALVVLASCPIPGPELHHFEHGQSELSTLQVLRAWLKPGWFVLYFHAKGFSYPGNPTWDRWRKCMERVCLGQWEDCVDLLAKGFDVVGAHWMAHKKYSMVPREHRYFGGNFWWARSEYLMTLPELPADTRNNRYEAEIWIGKSDHRPNVHDFAPHFPMSCPV